MKNPIILLPIIYLFIMINLMFNNNKYEKIDSNSIECTPDKIQFYNEIKKISLYPKFIKFHAELKSDIKIPEYFPIPDLLFLDSINGIYQIPTRILYRTIFKESNFKVNAKSHCGASGYMQIMPGTYKGIKKDILLQDINILNNLTPGQENLLLGIYYLKSKYDDYNDWELALAAYNAGSGNVKKYNGVPPFKETQNYVKFILKEK